MGLIGWRTILFIGLLVLLVGWGIGNGYVRLESDSYKCYGGTGLYSEVGKQRLLTWGRLHVYYQPLSWGCPADRRYDPTKYKVENGLLAPVTPNSVN